MYILAFHYIKHVSFLSGITTSPVAGTITLGPVLAIFFRAGEANVESARAGR